MTQASRLLTPLILLFGALAVSADRIDDLVQRHMRSKKIPGAAVAVTHRGKPVKAAAYGISNLELSVPASTDSVFEIGGATKHFTAVAILELVKDGKLSLQDSIVKHLRGAPETWRNITVYHLLTDTSGLKTITGEKGFELARRLTQEQFVEAAAALPPENAPGERAVYNLTGYILLGYIIENASGRDYWDYLNERLFFPLNIRTAKPRDPLLIIPNRADGYEPVTGSNLYRNRTTNLTDLFSAGAMTLSLNDFIKWDAALAGGQVLTPAGREFMFTPGKLNNGVTHGVGLGCRISKEGIFTKITVTGASAGFTTCYDRYPDIGLSIIVMVNSSAKLGAVEISKEIAASYLQDN